MQVMVIVQDVQVIVEHILCPSLITLTPLTSVCDEYIHALLLCGTSICNLLCQYKKGGPRAARCARLGRYTYIFQVER
jgi:hypothetical protein